MSERGRCSTPRNQNMILGITSAKKDENYFPLFSIFTKYLSTRQEELISVFKRLQCIGSGYMFIYILFHYTGVSL